MMSKSDPSPRDRGMRVKLPLGFALLAALVPTTIHADEPGRGQLADFEVKYLTSIIDHHFSALRITELAAGTDVERSDELDKKEGVAPTPGFEPTDARAALDDIKSLARRNNRMQREEIMTAQKFLREWYGIEHEPRLTPSGERMVERLENAGVGESFDVAFLRMFPDHHLTAAHNSLDCIASYDLEHKPLMRYCRAIVDAQAADIDEMREMLCNEYGDCDYRAVDRQRSSRSLLGALP